MKHAPLRVKSLSGPRRHLRAAPEVCVGAHRCPRHHATWSRRLIPLPCSAAALQSPGQTPSRQSAKTTGRVSTERALIQKRANPLRVCPVTRDSAQKQAAEWPAARGRPSPCGHAHRRAQPLARTHPSQPSTCGFHLVLKNRVFKLLE